VRGSIRQRAVARLGDKVARGALPLYLLPARFTLSDLQRACEATPDRELDKGALRRRIADASTKSVSLSNGTVMDLM